MKDLTFAPLTFTFFAFFCGGISVGSFCGYLLIGKPIILTVAVMSMFAAVLNYSIRWRLRRKAGS